MRVKPIRPLMSPAPAIGIANAATIRETKRKNFKAITDQLQCVALLQLACRNAGHLTNLQDKCDQVAADFSDMKSESALCGRQERQ